MLLIPLSINYKILKLIYLNLLKVFNYRLQKNNPFTTKPKNEGDPKGIIRYYPPANKEWFNSIYAYNKNSVKLLPVADNVIIKLIRTYFNMYNKKLNKNIKIRRLNNRKIKLSSRKIWVSKAELKHTSDNVLINLFIYDRNHNYYELKTINILKTFFRKYKDNYYKTLKAIKPNLNNKNLLPYILAFYKQKSMEYVDYARKENNILSLSNNIKDSKIFKNIENAIKMSYVKRILKKEIYIMYYKQIILFNKFKFRNVYILPLNKLLTKIYNKKIIFNIVRLKYYYLNSDILSQIIVSKTKNRKNRILNILSNSIKNIESPRFNPKLIIRESTKLIGTQNYIVKNEVLKIKQLEDNKDKLNEVLNSFHLQDKKLNLNDIVLDKLKYKAISGIRLEASGRLTRRFTAQRSIFKYKYKGNIKDIDSSYKGLSTVIMRGKIKSNTQFTKLNSKTRIGAFGLKGWISGV